MRKGVFIPDITVDMFKNATLESVEEFMTSGQMEDIEIQERLHGEWIQSDKDKYWAMCSVCKKEAICGDFMILTDFCPNCGAKMSANDRQVTGKLNGEIEKSKIENCPCDTCQTAIDRCGCQMHLCSEYQKWKEGEQ